MSHKLIIFGILIALLIGSIPSIHNGYQQIKEEIPSVSGVRGYVSHGIIKIDNNSDFAQLAKEEGWPGNGTQENPYIISGYDIDANGSGYAIYIGNTTAYFVVENCYLHNVSSVIGSEYAGAAITLYEVINGEFKNNTIDATGSEGIDLNSAGTDDISIVNNTFYDYSKGISVYYTYGSYNILIEDNVLDDSGHSDYAGGIMVLQGYGVKIINNTIINVTGGVSNYGIFIDNSKDSFLSDNEIYNVSGYGIEINNANENLVKFNKIYNASSYGIYLFGGANNNTIYGNFLYYNNNTGSTYNSTLFQARDDGYNNWWNSTTGIGNYWLDWAENNATNDNNGDGIVDYAYHVNGSAHSIDYYPLKVSNLSGIISRPLFLNAYPGNGSVNLSWEPPAYGADLINTYKIYRNGSLIANVSSGQLWYNDTSVVNGVIYTYYVIAANSTCSSLPSNAVQAKPMSVPSPPLNLTGHSGYKYINLTWEAPDCNGGGLITSYNIYRNGTLIANVSSGQLWYNDTHVTPGVNYTYFVTAVNAAGESNGSNKAVLMAFGEPSSPVNLTANPGNEYVNLSWAPPLNDGGCAVLGYRVYRNESLIANVSSEQLWYNDTSVINGVNYTYYVIAYNIEGNGTPSNVVFAIPRTVPSRPLNLSFVSGNEYVNLTWEPPAYNGGINVTSYKVYRDGNLTATVPSWHTWYNDTNVSNGKTYTYYVTAVNAAGESSRSSEVNATPSTVPDAPQNLDARVGNEYVNLTWEAPLFNGGAPIQGYRVYRNGTLIANVSSGQLWYNDSGLVNGVLYSYYVTAVNLGGEGSRSNVVYAKPITVPSSPQNARAKAGDSFVNITWDKPLSDGGSAIISYIIYRNNSYLAKVPATQLYYNDTHVVNFVDYTYYVTAVNLAGEGSRSNIINATPAPPRFKITFHIIPSSGGNIVLDNNVYDNNSSAYVYKGTHKILARPYYGYLFVRWDFSGNFSVADDFSNFTSLVVNGSGVLTAVFSEIQVPSPPENLTANLSSGAVVLGWQAPLSNGGANITEYRIYRGLSEGSEEYICKVSGTVLKYTDRNVSAGTTYYYYVTAVNLAGESARSNEAHVSVPKLYMVSFYISPTNAGKIMFNGTYFVDGGVGYFVNGTYTVTAINSSNYLFSRWEVSGGVRVYNASSATSNVSVYGSGSLKAIFVKKAAVLPPMPPIDLIANYTENGVVLTWHPPEDTGGSPVTEYKIYRSENGSDVVCIGKVSGNVTTFMDLDVKRGVTYYYYVTAVNSAGESGYSNRVSVTIPPNQSVPENNEGMSGLLGAWWLWLAMAIVLAAVAIAVYLYKGRNKRSDEEHLTRKERRIFNRLQEYLRAKNGEKIDVLVGNLSDELGVEPREVILAIDYGILKGMFLKETDNEGDVRVYFFEKKNKK